MKNWSLICSTIELGDIILIEPVKKPTLMEEAVEWFEEGSASHAAIYVGNQQVVEALSPQGIVKNNLSEYFDDKYVLVVRRVPGSYGALIVSKALTCIGTKYNYLQDAVNFFYYSAGKVKLTGFQKYISKRWRGWSNSYTCSQLVAIVIKETIGIDVVPGKDIGLVTPKDLLVTPIMNTVISV